MRHTFISSQKVRSRIDWQSVETAIGLLCLASLVVWMVVSQVSAGWFESRQAQNRVTFEEQVGIRVIRLALTAGGGMVDLQYQVIDPDKALVVHNTEAPPALVVGKSDQILATPFHSHNMRELQIGLTYHDLIVNTGGVLERGSRVTLKVGDFKLEDLLVE